jgi:hypothetical protein
LMKVPPPKTGNDGQHNQREQGFLQGWAFSDK